MKRLAWISLILSLLLGTDGIYMMATHYGGTDVNHFNLSDGGSVVAAAVLLLIISLVSFTLSRRSSESKNQRA
ncbi:MAG: hypothetical protein JWN30_2314 [Bacilli bacterium]|nr:hypothetical protein [Bacilli bacterium]